MVPTGIERVERAYAQHFAANAFDRLGFVAMTSWGRFGPLPKPRAINLVEALAKLWRGDGTQPEMSATTRRIGRRLQLDLLRRGEGGLYAQARRLGAAPVYLLVSHHHLNKPGVLARFKARTNSKFVILVHDLIPIAHPEYAKPGQAAVHHSRMETVARLADAVIVNSEATRRELLAFFERVGRAPPIFAIPLGIDAPVLPEAEAGNGGDPYFVCLGTIEPRKNHLLLLNLWRRLVNEYGVAAPRLVLIGRRGWENENVIDMIERCTAIGGRIEEHGALSDTAVARHLRGARALLLPSFAEGYGLPVAEALAAGVPAIVSDIAAVREVGGAVPEYLDPLDGAGWKDLILDYTKPDSLRRRAQLARMSSWRLPRWEDHFKAVDALIADLVKRPERALYQVKI